LRNLVVALLMTIVLSFIICSCDDDNGSVNGNHVEVLPDNPEEFFPMEVGDTWYYTEDDFWFAKRWVGEKILFEGDSCYPVYKKTVPEIIPDTLEQCLTIDSTGVYIHYLASQFKFDPPLKIPFDLASDNPHVYDATGVDIEDPGTTLHIQGQIEYRGVVQKTVPAGTFDETIELYYNDSAEKYTEFYARGVGLLDDGSIVLDSAIVGGVVYGR
jgi:hypothetical protein